MKRLFFHVCSNSSNNSVRDVFGTGVRRGVVVPRGVQVGEILTGDLLNHDWSSGALLSQLELGITGQGVF